MTNLFSLKCSHCQGSIIQKYDKIYCIQCSRTPTTKKPATISDKELTRDKKGDNSINLRINRAAQNKGRASRKWSR